MTLRLRWEKFVPLVMVAVAALSGCSKPAAAPDSKADAGSTAGAPADAKEKSFTVAMVPMGTQMSYWNSVHEGAMKAEKDLGIKVIWKGPATENDRASQKQAMQQFLDNSVDGILLAPTDARALAPEARTAMEKGIPVVLFDSAIEGEQGKDYVTLVATNNLAAGKMGGEHLMKVIGSGGKAILFRHQEGHDSTGSREAGALEAMEEGQADILEKDRYTGESASASQVSAMNMIDVIKEAEGIFASNQSATEGLLLALRNTGLAGKIRVVGFDSSPMLVDAVRKGDIDALVVQDPKQIGYDAVKMMADHLAGKDVPPVVEMPARLVTKENIDDPAISALFQQ